MTADKVEYASPDWLVPSILLIEEDASVLVPIRALAALVSYALAGPSNDASTRRRDEAVAAAHAAIVAHWTEHKHSSVPGGEG